MTLIDKYANIENIFVEIKDIKNGFVLDKRTLSLLLISPSVWFYALRGTEYVELIESSEDINATLDII